MKHCVTKGHNLTIHAHRFSSASALLKKNTVFDISFSTIHRTVFQPGLEESILLTNLGTSTLFIQSSGPSWRTKQENGWERVHTLRIFDQIRFLFESIHLATYCICQSFILCFQIFMHGNNLNSLHQLILPEILPSELGGMLPPYDMGTWARTLLDHAYDEETDYCPESYTLSVKDLEKDLSPKSMKRFVSFVHYICPFTVFIPPESSRELLWIRKMSCFARGVKKPRSSFC